MKGGEKGEGPAASEQVHLLRGLRFGVDPRRSIVEALASLSIPFVPVRSYDLAGTSLVSEVRMDCSCALTTRPLS